MPDMIALDKNGLPKAFGSRRHSCFSHEGYRVKCRQIVTQLAKAIGTHPAVFAWQVDNEYGCHDTAISSLPQPDLDFASGCKRDMGTFELEPSLAERVLEHGISALR